MKIVIPAILIFGGLGALITVGVMRGGIPDVHVRELLGKQQSYTDQTIKLHGKIKKIHKSTRPLEFEMCDKEYPEQVVMAVVDSTCPDVFKETNDVAVEGQYDPATGKIMGNKIYTKCPSKYEGSDQLKEGAPGYDKAKPKEEPAAEGQA